ncbi:hypothetical protein GCM10007388_44730 [Pseudoduganella plicata]|uniref:Uncharacterized protein n=1 Tax=Pseudoduganella plicata TaxID=321984 RepID=A0AA88CA72_9BURK|nr:hypothetical protein GCM10007388_44730 [Pseudoduganella plicata]
MLRRDKIRQFIVVILDIVLTHNTVSGPTFGLIQPPGGWARVRTPALTPKKKEDRVVLQVLIGSPILAR